MEIEMTSGVEKSASIAAKSVIGPSNVVNRRLTKAKARARRAEAKEEKAEKGRVCRDRVGRAVDRISLTSVPQQAKVARAYLCQQHGAHGGQAHFLDHRHSSGGSGCLEKAQRNEKAKERGSPASAS